MSKNKIVAIVMIVLGAALVITAATFWLDTISTNAPGILGENLRNWITPIAGLGASIMGWMDLFKIEKFVAIESPTAEWARKKLKQWGAL